MMSDRGYFDWFTAAVLLSFCLDWLAVGLNWHRTKLITKPLAMTMVIVWTLAASGLQLGWLVGVLLLAQFLGLLGDIFLLLPNSFFLHGLMAFLLGHVLYDVLVLLILARAGFNSLTMGRVVVGVLLGVGIWVVAMVLFYLVFIPLSGPGAITKKFWAAIQVYGWILSSTGGFALCLVVALRGIAGQFFLLPVGTFLFWVSDSLLAYNKFLNPVRRGQLWVRTSYHLAQFCLAAGFLTAILSF
jgi:uncharacterized membrane protein YhhN